MKRETGYYDIELPAECGTLEEKLSLEDLKRRKFYINYEIEPLLAMDTVRHICQINAEDRDLSPEERKPILIYLSSPGGDVDAGFELIDAIEASKTPVYTINPGFQYSMAFLIGLAGHKRYATKNAKFLMHDGSSVMYDSTSKLKDRMEFEKLVEERVQDFVISHSRLTPEEYRERYRMEWYMYADEAKKYGFTDFIIGEDCPLDEVI